MGTGIGAAVVALAAAAGMSPQQIAGERVVYAFPGASAPPLLLRAIHRGQAAGVILFSRNIRSRAQVRRLTHSLQRARPAAAPPLIVAIDQEGGLVKRLPGAPTRSAGQMRSARVARRQGVAAARNLRGVGVNVNFAPVLDVGRPGGNMRALGRSFSGSAGGVAALGGAFAGGLAAGGVVATGKHFPGLGAARGDQDQAINRIRLPLDRLRAVDEAPYRRLAGRLPMVMVSSAIYPALDRRRPALFSPRVATDELRVLAGFDGVSVSDDLEVPALLGYGSPGRRALACARAGVDLLLFAHTHAGGVAARRALAAEISRRAGTRLASMASVVRVRALRAALGGG